MKTSYIALFIAAGLAVLPSLAHAARSSDKGDKVKATIGKKGAITTGKGSLSGKGSSKMSLDDSKGKSKTKKAPLSKGELARMAAWAAYMKQPEVPTKAIALSGQRNSHALVELAAEDYQEASAYEGTRDSTTLPAAPTGGKVQKMLWFHGAGQIPNNLIIRRLARALAAEGVSIEIHSVAYERGMKDAIEFINAQSEPILIGGHSMGTGPADMLASTPHPKIKGAILLNGAGGNGAVVPTLQLKGSVMDGPASSRNPLVTPVQVMHADHSLRYHSPDGKGPDDKDDRNRSVDTWELNRLVAQQVKAFLETVPEK